MVFVRTETTLGIDAHWEHVRWFEAGGFRVIGAAVVRDTEHGPRVYETIMRSQSDGLV